MHGAWSFLLGLAPLLVGFSDERTIAPDDFEGWYKSASEGKLRIPAITKDNAKRYRYVFVGGFNNENMPGYFAQNAKELRAHGISRKAIHFVYPSSHRSLDENADATREEFLKIAGEGPEKLVVIAHSRGACDTLAFALKNGEFVRERVEALYLVQGPFGGTVLADYVMGTGPSMDRRMSVPPRIVAHLLGRMERLVLSRGGHGGLRGLTADASQDYWDQLREEHAAMIPIVGSKTYYVQTETHPSQLRFLKKPIGKYLQTYVGPNDGIVGAVDQALPGLGTVLVIIDAGHSDLTNRFPAARAKPKLRRALIQCILMAVGQSEKEPEALIIP
jgi:pimeloyl-ACP methyl ester carboxylesterase